VVRRGAVEGAASVRLFLTDVDGVLTDGGIVYDAAGIETKRFHVRDGHGIKLLQRAGVAVGIITGAIPKSWRSGRGSWGSTSCDKV